MKNILFRYLEDVVTMLLLPLRFAPYLGLLFAVSLIGAGIAGALFERPEGWAYLSVGWKVYAGLGVFTSFFLVTFDYQHCCVGLSGFWQHLSHCSWQSFLVDALGGFLWPVVWLMLERSLRRLFSTSFAHAVLDALEYWFVSSWRGTTVTILNLKKGTVTTRRVKTTEEAADAIYELATDKD